MIIRLDTIDSTNSFLKEYSRYHSVANYTVVTANHQTAGRGQLQAKWLSETGKNLTFSMYYQNDNKLLFTTELFALNIAVSLALIESLNTILPKNYIKWPNDIVSNDKKVAGILIENSIGVKLQSVIGIGLNVNQLNFENLPQATSLYAETQKQYDLDILLHLLISQLKHYITLWENNQISILWQKYHTYLYQYKQPSLWQIDNQFVSGTLIQILPDGRAVIDINGTQQTFQQKEIKLQYPVSN